MARAGSISALEEFEIEVNNLNILKLLLYLSSLVLSGCNKPITVSYIKVAVASSSVVCKKFIIVGHL